MKQYDLVELVADCERYNKKGIFKGMFGAIMSEEPISGCWQVIFSEFHTGKDIADILIRETDLKVHDYIPADRIPLKR